MKENVARQVVETMYGHFASGNLDAVLSTLSENIEWTLHGPSEIPYFGSYVGKEEVKTFFARMFETESLTSFLPSRFIAEGNSVAVVGSEEGSMKATRRGFSAKWVQVFQVDEGKISKFDEYIDFYEMLNALS